MKKNITKLMAIMGVVIISMSLVACGNNKEVETAANTYLSEIKSGNFENNKMIKNIIKNTTEIISDSKKKNAEIELIKLVFTSFDYDIEKIEVKDNVAKLHLNIKSNDIITIFTNVQSRITKMQAEKKDTTDPEIKLQLFKDTFAQMKSERVNKPFELEMNKKEDKWVVVNEKELLDQISGGILSKIIGFEAVKN